MVKPTVICLTPMRNEAAILDRFLQCASLWADHIIIADNFSDDGSQDIARSYPKVTLINNPATELDEESRQKLLIAEARKIPGPRLLIALDTDEALTANFMNHPEWETVLNAPPGSIIEFEWVNILPEMTSYWAQAKAGFYYPLGFMDDGSEHIGGSLHSPRIPEPAFAPRIRLNSIKLLHYGYTDYDRSASKHIWYQCWEKVRRPTQSSVWIYRFYNLMYSFPKDEILPLQQEWFTGYEEKGIDMTSICRPGVYWRDREVLELLSKYGSEKFKKLAIWHIDWFGMAKKLGIQGMGSNYEDPRGWFEKLVHSWLKITQPFRKNPAIRILDKVLDVFFR
jgi:glycosyltransferase involved in cell wall biosynthesis